MNPGSRLGKAFRRSRTPLRSQKSHLHPRMVFRFDRLASQCRDSHSGSASLQAAFDVLVKWVESGQPPYPSQCIPCGQLACPPEDCGGIPGFYDLIEALSEPNHELHEEMLDWIGEFNPQAFSVESVNRLLTPSRRRRDNTSGGWVPPR